MFITLITILMSVSGNHVIKLQFIKYGWADGQTRRAYTSYKNL